MGWWHLFRNSWGRVGGRGGRHFWIFMIMKMFDDRRCNKKKPKKQFQYDVSCSWWTICVPLRRQTTVACWFFFLFLQARAAVGILSISAHSVICGGENERQILRLIGYDRYICLREIFDECLNLTLWACSSAPQPLKKSLLFASSPSLWASIFFLCTPLLPVFSLCFSFPSSETVIGHCDWGGKR